jgi:hypothetical protein
VSIAYFESGQGAPILHLNDFPFSHIQVEDRYIPGWHEVVKRSNKFIRLDPRGMGMSDRDVGKLTLDGWVSDIEAAASDSIGLASSRSAPAAWSRSRMQPATRKKSRASY